MTHDAIKARIHSLVPDIIELKFGCEILVKGLKHVIYMVEDDEVSACMIFGGTWVDCDIQKPLFSTSSDIVILGRPITLADVLRAISWKWYKYENEHWVFFGDEKTQIISLCAQWNLSLDFDGQSDECKQFIGGLLGVK